MKERMEYLLSSRAAMPPKEQSKPTHTFPMKKKLKHAGKKTAALTSAAAAAAASAVPADCVRTPPLSPTYLDAAGKHGATAAEHPPLVRACTLAS
mmetsp:Transcript_15159/g.32645  ORF Transcript_15159/g.32645 Transcript_15159/m.32645 type:complete len:95 (-) Transcript_15159:387-671(-)